MKRFVSLFLAIFTLFLPLCACTYDDREVYFSVESGAGNIFRIGDYRCSVKEAKIYLSNYKNLYGRIGGIDLWNGGFDTVRMEGSIKDAVLSHLTRVYAMDVYAEENEVALSEHETEEIKLAAAEYFSSLSDEEKEYFEVSEKDIEKMYENYALAEKVYFDLMNTVDEEVSEDEARVMDAYVLFTKNADTANELAAKIAAGEDFETLVNTYSEGDISLLSFARGTYTGEIEDVVFSLDNGQISEMLSDDGGYYFFECVSVYNQAKSEENKANVISERKAALLDKIVSDQTEKYYSSFNEKSWDEIEFRKDDSINTDSFFAVLDAHLSY